MLFCTTAFVFCITFPLPSCWLKTSILVYHFCVFQLKIKLFLPSTPQIFFYLSHVINSLMTWHAIAGLHYVTARFIQTDVRLISMLRGGMQHILRVFIIRLLKVVYDACTVHLVPIFSLDCQHFLDLTNLIFPDLEETRKCVIKSNVSPLTANNDH